MLRTVLNVTGGGNGFNRVLCAPSNVITKSCQWGPGRNGKACNSKCPNGWLTLTKNSHIAAQKSGCKTGTYAPVCCQSVTTVSHGMCYATTLDHMLSGSLAGRDDPTGIGSYTIGRAQKIRKKSLSKRSGTSGNCGGPQYLPLYAIPVDIPA